MKGRGATTPKEGRIKRFSSWIKETCFIYKSEIILFSIWGLTNIILFIWKFYDVKAKCNGVIKGPYSLIGDIPENRACQASYASCCKNYPFPDGPYLNPHYEPCTPVCDDACNLLGRVLGHLLNYNLALTLLPILRNSIWTKAFKVLPFERSVFFHRWIGLFIFICMLLHLISWWITQPFPSAGWVCWSWTLGFRSDQFNGQLAFFFHAIAALFALNYFRRKFFELFFYTHILYLGVFAFGILHTMGVQGYWGWKYIFTFEDDFFIYYLAVPWIMFMIDRVIRFYKSNFVKTDVIIAETEQGAKLTRLLVKRNNFKFDSGQYCFINVPEISKLQWHPFSISSSPESPQVFSFHIKSMGKNTWTDALFQLASHSPKTLKLKIDGPYGAKSLNPESYQTNILFCGGVGATPMMSMLTEMIDRHYYFSQKVKRVYFHWVIRSADNMSWFSDVWERIFMDNQTTNIVTIGNIEFVFYFHLTQSGDASMRNINNATAIDSGSNNNIKKPKPVSRVHSYNQGVNSIPLQTSKEEISSDNSNNNNDDVMPLKLPLSALKSLDFLQNVPSACFVSGRPKIKNIIEKARQDHMGDDDKRIAVFACGPQEMTDDLGKYSCEFSDKQFKFDFHQETFFL